MHALRRAGTEPEFRWHMHMTETLELLCQAYDELEGRAPGTTKAEVMAQRPHPRRGNCERHRDEASAYRMALESLVSACRDGGTSSYDGRPFPASVDADALAAARRILDDGPGEVVT